MPIDVRYNSSIYIHRPTFPQSVASPVQLILYSFHLRLFRYLVAVNHLTDNLLDDTCTLACITTPHMQPYATYLAQFHYFAGAGIDRFFFTGHTRVTTKECGIVNVFAITLTFFFIPALTDQPLKLFYR